jgi:hypothetical protein
MWQFGGMGNDAEIVSDSCTQRESRRQFAISCWRAKSNEYLASMELIWFFSLEIGTKVPSAKGQEERCQFLHDHAVSGLKDEEWPEENALRRLTFYSSWIVMHTIMRDRVRTFTLSNHCLVVSLSSIISFYLI